MVWSLKFVYYVSCCVCVCDSLGFLFSQPDELSFDEGDTLYILEKVLYRVFDNNLILWCVCLE